MPIMPIAADQVYRLQNSALNIAPQQAMQQ